MTIYLCRITLKYDMGIKAPVFYQKKPLLDPNGHLRGFFPTHLQALLRLVAHTYRQFLLLSSGIDACESRNGFPLV